MRFSSIDVGSNTLRLLIGDIRDNMISRVYSDRAVTRLAEGMAGSGMLGEENMRRSVSALKTFSDVMARYEVVRVKAVGTSALREAENSREFLDRSLRDAGIQIEVISGLREAELTAKGVLMGLKDAAESLIIDIGGGSTEWIIPGAQGSLTDLESGSLSLGVVRLLERFISSDPPSSREVSDIIQRVDAELLPLKHRVSGRFPALTTFVGTGGTITTLAAVDLGMNEYDGKKVHMHMISLENLSRLKNELLTMPVGKRKQIPGLEKERADLIIPGILLTIRFMEIFGFRTVTVSDHGLLEGLLKEMDDENSF